MRLFLSLIAAWAAWQSPISRAAPNPSPSASPLARARTHRTLRKIAVPLPKEKALAPAPVGFKFVAAGKGGLTLQFFSTGNALSVDQTQSMIFGLTADQGVKVVPNVVSSANWPQVSKPLPLSLKGALRGKTYQLHGVASYVACPKGKKKACKRYKSTFDLKYVAK